MQEINVDQVEMFEITIDPNGYEGNISTDIIPSLFYLKEPQKFKFPTGKHHYISTGATAGSAIPPTSYIYFDIDNLGKITKLYNSDAASLNQDKNTITFRTAYIKFDLSNYHLTAKLSALSERFITRTFQGVKLILSITYSLDSGISVTSKLNGITSALNFHVNKNGFVETDDKVTAIGGDKFLKIKTTSIEIDPDEFSIGQPIKLSNNEIIYSKRKINFIRGLLTSLEWKDSNGKSIIKYFIPI